MIDDHITEFVGLPVVDFSPEKGADDYAGVVYRIGYTWDDEISVVELLPKFFENPKVSETQGLIIGCFDETCDDYNPIYQFLLENKAKLPNLRGLFLGEATQEESEISWIEHGDITPFFTAFPGLEDLRIRGGSARMEPVRHIALKTLVFESGGLPSGLMEAVSKSVFPELEHLEFYTGTEDYEGEVEIDDTRPFLYDNPFPKLKYLGLRNCELADEVAQLAAAAPVLDQLEVLDLSLGNLRDVGGQALLDSEGVRKLQKLDLHYHYLSETMMDALCALPIEVDVSDPQQPDEYGGEQHFYIAITE